MRRPGGTVLGRIKGWSPSGRPLNVIWLYLAMGGTEPTRADYVRKQRRQLALGIWIPLAFGVLTFCLVAPLMALLNVILPHLPWYNGLVIHGFRAAVSKGQAICGSSGSRFGTHITGPSHQCGRRVAMNICEQAEAFRLLLLMGVIDKSEVIAWADGIIAARDVVPGWLLDVSRSSKPSTIA